MHGGIQRVLPAERPWDLFGITAARRLEAAAQARLPAHTLMQRAGLSVARMALAVAPHAESVCVLAGPGNNGGDGLEAAMHLVRAGRRVQVLLLADPLRLPADAARSLARAREAGAVFLADLPTRWQGLLIDALLGVGANRAPEGAIAGAIRASRQFTGPRLAIDLPSGLHADTGARLGADAVHATHTLSLLALKPGLFTGEGRELAGRIWHDDLGVDVGEEAPLARLAGPAGLAGTGTPARTHAQHKGSFGDVVVIGGDEGMSGAAQLAAMGALAAGAGRVYLSPLAADGPAAARPELMHREAAWTERQGLLASAIVVCGCGGGTAVAGVLEPVLRTAPRLVLDADALNAVARGAALQDLLARRARQGFATVMTPHPLEAARLAGVDTASVQADRLGTAVRLAARFDCTVLLKGSGTVIASPGTLPRINATGNAMLATAGTGDVLAGWIGGLWAQQPSTSGLAPATAGAWRHGAAADAALAAGDTGPLRAACLIEAMRALR